MEILVGSNGFFLALKERPTEAPFGA